MRSSPLRGIVLVGMLALLGAVGWFVFDQVLLWRRLGTARAALERTDIPAAREALAAAVARWPASGEVQYLAAQAARRSGELDEARGHLDRARELGWTKAAVDLERTLIRVQAGDFSGLDDHLTYCLNNDHPEALLILEVLTPAYLRSFQIQHAVFCCERWIVLAPADARPWNYRGIAAERMRSTNLAIESYEKAVSLDPTKPGPAVALVRVLLEANKPAEAAVYLETLKEARPDDPEVLLLEARCLHQQGKNDEAVGCLDRLLARKPKLGPALYLRGKIAQEVHKNPKEAAVFLRQAAEEPGVDREVVYTWLLCLRQVGTPAEVKACEERLDRLKADQERLGGLTKRIAELPADPDLRREAGEICLRNGRDEDGLRWLYNVLERWPDHAASHRTLADYFQRKGHVERAQRHRAMAEGKLPGR